MSLAFLHSSRLILMLCFLLPAGSLFSWDSAASDSARTSRDRSREAVDLPIAIRGEYKVGDFNDLRTMLLVDRNRLYLVGGFNIVAMKRIESTDDSVRFDSDTVIWSYEVEEPDDLLLRNIGSTGLYSPASMAALTPDMLVFAEEELNFLDPSLSTTWIIGLDRETGEEAWRYTIPGATGAALNFAGGEITVRYQLNEDTGGFPFPETRQDPDYSSRLMRIAPGSDTPSAEIGIHSAGNNPDLVSAGSGFRWFLIENDQVSAFASRTLERRWTYPEGHDSLGSLHGSEDIIQNMVVDDTRLFLTLDTHLVLSMTYGGEVAWVRELTTEECTHPLRMSHHEDTLVVAGLCGDQLVGLDPATGDIRWQQTTAEQVSVYPPIVSGRSIYLSVRSDDLSSPSDIHVYDAQTGDLLQEGEGFITGRGIVTPLAAADGFVYGATIGSLGTDEGRVVSYETEPASIAADFESSEPFPCGVPRDTSLPLPVTVRNLGPGLAPNVMVTIRPIGLRVDWEIGGDWEHDTFGGYLRVRLGDMEAFDSIPLDIRVVPLEEGEVTLETTVVSDVRNIDPDGGIRAATFEVREPVPPELDIAIDWVEVTQGIQNKDHSIGLIAGKPTLLRVYTTSNADVAGVRARMHITGSARGSNWSANFDETVAPLEECVAVTSDGPDRSDLGTTFNFLVPSRMLSGVPDEPYQVEIIIDPDNALQEDDRSNNLHTMELDYKELPPICIKTHRVRHLAMGGGDTYGPSRYPQDHLERAVSMLPTREILQFRTGNTLEKMGFFEWVPYELDPGGSQNTGRILATLWMHQKTSRDPRQCKSRGAITVHAGLVAENNRSTASGRQFNGIAYRPGRSHVVRIWSGSSPSVNVPRGGQTLAHELGHNFGRRHVNCGGPDNPDGNYPYPACELAPLDDESYFGVDLMDPENPELVVPRPGDSENTLSDLLSYANTTWTSDYTWAAMRAYMLTNKKVMQARMSGEGLPEDSLYRSWLKAWKGSHDKTILVTATIEGDGETTMEDILPVSESVVPEDKALDLVARSFAARQDDSAYSIDLLDGDGETILSVPVVPDPIDDAEEGVMTLGALVPMPDGLEALRISDGNDTELAVVDRSPAAPQVTLTAPTGGHVVEDFLVVDWDATDADGDELLTLIQYSDDDGATWITLTTNAPEAPQSFDASLIPGAIGTALVRVVVSDGFNATEAMSDPFTLMPHEPIVEITRPEDGATFPVGTPVFATGNAYDPEDGPLLEEALVWEVEGIGEIGFGGSVIVGDLPIGTHRLILTATDSDDESVSDEVLITVEPRGASRRQIADHLLDTIKASVEWNYDLNEDDAVDSADVLHAE